MWPRHFGFMFFFHKQLVGGLITLHFGFMHDIEGDLEERENISLQMCWSNSFPVNLLLCDSFLLIYLTRRKDVILQVAKVTSFFSCADIETELSSSPCRAHTGREHRIFGDG